MKKFFIYIFTILTYLLISSPVSAQSAIDLCPEDTDTNFQALCFLDPGSAIPTILTFALIIAVIIALFYLIWGGIKWITSGGDKGNVETARNHIISAIIGLIVVFLAWFIINLILNVFLGRDVGGNIELPTIGGSGGGGGKQQLRVCRNNEFVSNTDKGPSCRCDGSIRANGRCATRQQSDGRDG